MSVTPDNVLAFTAERIFAVAETALHLRQVDQEPNQVWWHYDEHKVNLSRLVDVGCWTLETICTDEQLTSTKVYLFNGGGIVAAISACAPRAEAATSSGFVFDAVDDPFNQDPLTQSDQRTFLRMLVSGLRPDDV